MTKTYLDANILIAGFRSDALGSRPALSVLGDPGRTFVASQYLRLDTLRKSFFLSARGRDSFHGGLFRFRQPLGASG